MFVGSTKTNTSGPILVVLHAADDVGDPRLAVATTMPTMALAALPIRDAIVWAICLRLDELADIVADIFLKLLLKKAPDDLAHLAAERHRPHDWIAGPGDCIGTAEF